MSLKTESPMAQFEDESIDEPAVPALVARRRADTYRLLADAFNAEPTAEMLDRLRQTEAVTAFEALGATFPAEVERLLAESGQEGAVDRLACEFTRLFIGPGKHIGPYESLHRDDQPAQHWGPSTAAVKRFVEHHGLAYDPGFQGMPDHISVEFQFMAEMAGAEADAIEQGQDAEATQAREVQRVFHKEHLSPWIPKFCDKVIELAELDFYKDFAHIAKAVVEADESAAEEES
jgi:TorA maturation chaperone TorD